MGKVDAKPRGRMTAYAYFVQTCREEHKKKHPDETVIFAEFSRKCAERWKVNIELWSSERGGDRMQILLLYSLSF